MYIIYKESPALKYQMSDTYRTLKEAREYLGYVMEEYRADAKTGYKKQAASWSHDYMTLNCMNGGDMVRYQIEKVEA